MNNPVLFIPLLLIIITTIIIEIRPLHTDTF